MFRALRLALGRYLVVAADSLCFLQARTIKGSGTSQFMSFRILGLRAQVDRTLLMYCNSLLLCRNSVFSWITVSSRRIGTFCSALDTAAIMLACACTLAFNTAGAEIDFLWHDVTSPSSNKGLYFNSHASWALSRLHSQRSLSSCQGRTAEEQIATKLKPYDESCCIHVGIWFSSYWQISLTEQDTQAWHSWHSRGCSKS